jgi:hypothetical protein
LPAASLVHTEQPCSQLSGAAGDESWTRRRGLLLAGLLGLPPLQSLLQ